MEGTVKKGGGSTWPPEVVVVFHRNGKLFQWRRTQNLCPQEGLVKSCLYENRDISNGL